MKILKKNLTKYVLHGMFVICFYFAIRWSDIPIPSIFNCKIIDLLFVHKNVVDPSMLNVVTGYMTGYWVYLFTILIPEVKQNRPVKDIVLNRLSVLYQNSVYLLLLMCKNCCTEEEWRDVHSNTTSDIECLNDKFFDKMEKFDIRSNADTIFLHKESQLPVRWYEYLEMKYEMLYKELDELFLQYHIYLDDETINRIIVIKNSKYIDTFLGKGYAFTTLIHTKKDDIGYYDNFPISMSFSQDTKLSPFFADININLLRDHVNDLKELYYFLIEYKKKHDLEILHEDYAISKLKENEAGHYNTSVFKYPLQLK